MLTTILVFLLVAALTWLYLRHRGRQGAGLKPIPGPTGLPYLGPGSLLHAPEIYLRLYDLAGKFGAIFGFELFGHNVVILNDPDVIRRAYGADVFSNRPKSFVGQYVLTYGGDLAFDEHYGKHTVLLRQMVHKALQTFSDGNFRGFEANTAREIDGLVQKIHGYHGNDFDMSALVRSSIGNLMHILLYGDVPHGNESDVIMEFSDKVLVLTETSMNLFLFTFPFARLLPGRPGDTFRATCKARDAIFERYVDSAEETTGLYKTFVDFQKETNSKYDQEVISDGNVKSVILDVVAAGTSTSVTYLTGAILTLLNNRDCMKQIQNEIDVVVGRERKPTLADKGDMHYTMACLYEILRYVCIGTLGIPHRVGEDTEFDGHFFKKDTLLYANMWFVHRNPALWPDPWTFKPERFLDDNGHVQPASAECRRNLIPFLVGKRMCTGGDLAISRMFLYLTTLLQVFDLQPPREGELRDPDPMSYNSGVILLAPEYLCRAEMRKVETDV